ncbi:hypothetical protein BC826DRAFT_1058596 [Russula brevipes]|nr:hypothetical protein BC826DRAFT_1058596 [Russula brevipes]
MRLRQDPPSVTQSQSRSRKRKTPPSAESLQPVPPPPPAAMQHTLPPAHTLVPPPHLSGHILHPPSYQYPPGDYPPAGLPPPHSLGPPPPTEPSQDQRPQPQPSNGASNTASAGASRTLSQSKRAEQIARHNARSVTFQPPPYRHVKALESRSQLLDAALASADEANRRWEECRALVDQLRIENAALRAALSQTQMLSSGGSTVQPPGGNDESNSRVAEGTKGAEEPKE